ncbi:MAG: ADP-ribose pyrophosphatase [Candidatus Saccharibacteria bacterium]|nr:ADP-ribose pyrophosphatase [Candidatus Saccharibacteria bacterium]
MIWRLLGRGLYYLGYPALYIYLRGSRRTRLMVLHDRKLLVTKTWLGNGQWSLPGGGLHRGEDPALGASRELYEETGIRASPERLRFIGHYKYAGQGFRFEYDLYAVAIKQAPDLRAQPIEIADLAWLSRRELAAEPLAPDVAAAVAAWQP